MRIPKKRETVFPSSISHASACAVGKLQSNHRVKFLQVCKAEKIPALQLFASPPNKHSNKNLFIRCCYACPDINLTNLIFLVSTNHGFKNMALVLTTSPNFCNNVNVIFIYVLDLLSYPVAAIGCFRVAYNRIKD